MPPTTRLIAADVARTIAGWALLALLIAMVALWTTFGFAPQLIERVPEPLAAFGQIDQWWPIAAGALAGAGAAWALAPGVRIESGGSEGGRASLRPWAALILGVSSLLMMFSAYWPCADGESPVWSALRHAAEAFEGYVAEPFGSVAGCPAEFPETLMAGVLFGKVTLVLVAALALARIFRDTIDRFNARRARHVVLFSGVSEETVEMLREVASRLTDRQTLLVLDTGPDAPRALAAVREIRRDFAHRRLRAKIIAYPLDVADSEALEAFARSRGQRGIRGMYLVSSDSSSNLRALSSLLPQHDLSSATATTEVPGRVLIRVDNPWHAEDWRRKQMVGRPGWLFDALSVREMAARHVVAKLKERGVDCVVISGLDSFSLAVLADLSFEHRLDGFLARTSVAARTHSEHPEGFQDFVPRTPKVLLVGEQAQDLADHFREQLARFGVDRGDEIIGIRPSSTTDAAMAELTDAGQKPALIIDGKSDHDATFRAVRHPDWTIFAWDKSVRGLNAEPLLGQLWLVGPTLAPVPDFGLDVWDRLGAAQHMSYVLNHLEGKTQEDTGNKTRGIWESLSPFSRESNIRSFASFTRSVRRLGGVPRRLGTDLGPGGEQVPAPIESEQDFRELAEREHESWVQHHKEYGFRPGDTRVGKRHPDMVEWSKLTQEAVDKDLDNVHVTNDLLRALGFILVKAE